MANWAAGHRLQNGKYVIQQTLGQGGFGITYKALHINLNQGLVIKTPNDFLRSDPNYGKFRERFITEGRLLAKLGQTPHPHIVRVHDLFQETEGDTWYLVMDFVRGESLWDLVQHRGALPETEAVKYICQIGNALKVVHDADLVHRDVKPDNIMIRESKEAVLIDFGIAKEIVPNVKTTGSGGNENFAPYEQIQRVDRKNPGTTVDPPTLDIYSIAASLYYAVTGQKPTSSSDRKSNNEELKPPKEFAPNLSDRVNNAILKGMALEPEYRPQSVQEWLTLLRPKTLRGHYEIISELGKGGFGKTYLAQDKHLPGNPTCVVKQLSPTDRSPQVLEIARRLFDKEAEVLQRLGKHHDHIPTLLAHFEENGEFYLVQEFIDGLDLSRELTPGKRLSEPYVKKLLGDTLEVLAFVHQQGVIHRDIKPQNLIRRRLGGKIVLIDFGAVKEIVLSDAGQTQASVAIGTPGYMPSEQASLNPKPSSDIYALGIIAIQALTGINPNPRMGGGFPQDLNGEIIWRNQVQVSDWLADILTNMVRYDFSQRYKSGAEALEALNSVNIRENEQQIKNYLDKFIRKYGKIDDFMGVLDQGRGADKDLPLSELYVEQKTDKNYAFSDVLNDVLNDKQKLKLIITGGAGLGKTTFLQMIGVKSALEWQKLLRDSPKSWKIPVFVKLADYAYKYADPNQSKPYKLSDYIAELLRNPPFSFQVTVKKVEEDLHEGRYLLLLDALDEIGAPDLRKQVRDRIDDVLNESKSKTIVTSRSAIGRQSYMIQGASLEELQPLAVEQIQEYVEKCRKYIQQNGGEEQAAELESLREQLANRSQLRERLNNPLLLYMMVGQKLNPKLNGNSTPSNHLSDLYETVANYLIEERCQARLDRSGKPEIIDEEKRHNYLRHIARWLHQGKYRNAPKDLIIEQVIKKVSPELSTKEAGDHLDFLATEIGLLQESQKEYTFIHFTFQEFFAADYYRKNYRLNMLEQARSELIKDALDTQNEATDYSWWEPVITYYYELSQDHDLLRSLLQENKNIFATRPLLAVDWLMKVVPDEQVKNHYLYGYICEGLQKIYYREPSYELLQKEILSRLQKIGGQSVLNFLENELGESSDRRQKAIRALGKIGTDEAVDKLISETKYYLEEESEILQCVVEALSDAKSSQALVEVENIFCQLISQENNELTNRIVSYLVTINRSDYIHMLLGILQQFDNQDWLQKTILAELGKSSDSAVRALFWNRLQSVQSNVIEVAALLDAINFTAGDDISNYAKSLLEENNTTLVTAAVRFFSRQQDTSVIEDLLILLICGSPEQELQLEILKALGQLGQSSEPNDSNEQEIHKHIEDNFNSLPLLMEQGFLTLGQFGGKKSFDYLSEKLNFNTENQEIKAAIIQALYQISKRREILPNRNLCQQVLEYLKNTQVEDRSLAEAAVFLLFKNSSQDQIKELLSLTKKPSLLNLIPFVVLRQKKNRNWRQILCEELIGYLLDKNNKCPQPLRINVTNWLDECIRDYAQDEVLVASAFKLKLKLLTSGDARWRALREALNNNEEKVSIRLVAIEQAPALLEQDEFLQNFRDLLRHKFNPEVVTKVIELLGENCKGESETIQEIINELLNLLEDTEYEQKAFATLFSIAKQNGLLEHRKFNSW